MRMCRLSALVYLLALSLALPSPAPAEDVAFISDLANLEIQELMQQEVSSVLRKPQPLSAVASAVYVITAEDIKRSGVRALPELLRMVPGVTVVRTNASDWQVTSRGFDSNGAAKLLVLIDGRSVYSPLFSGVFWDVQDVIPEDIERIEVIRGPGAVSWGENAVNGVINIITKHSKETTGTRIVGGGTDRGGASGTISYGAAAGEDTHYRIFSKYLHRDGLQFSGIDDSENNSDFGHGGFRLDSVLSPRDSFTVQGDIYGGNRNRPSSIIESLTPPFTTNPRDYVDVNGGNLLAHWDRKLSDSSEIKVQAFYDRTARDTLLFSEDRNTFDLDAQHHLLISEDHDLVYGATVRVTSDSIRESFQAQFNPSSRTDLLSNAFIQDEITIVPETLHLIPGIKLGYNDYSQFDYQPSLKGTWNLSSESMLWASAARAIRSPARIDEDIRAYANPVAGADGTVAVQALNGTKGFDAEQLYAYELGFRTVPLESVSFDAAAFYHVYDELLSIEPRTPFIETDPTPAHLVVPFELNNDLHGSAYGIELFSRWSISTEFDISAAYSYIELDFAPDAGTFDPGSDNLEEQTPHHQAVLQSHWDITDDLQLNFAGFFVDTIGAFPVSSYIRTDLHLAYRLDHNWMFDFAVFNLTDEHHREFGTRETGVEIERTFSGRFTYTFE